MEAVKLKPFTLEVNHRKKCDLRIDVTLSVQQSLEMEEQKPLAVQALELSVLPVFFRLFLLNTVNKTKPVLWRMLLTSRRGTHKITENMLNCPNFTYLRNNKNNKRKGEKNRNKSI